MREVRVVVLGGAELMGSVRYTDGACVAHGCGARPRVAFSGDGTGSACMRAWLRCPAPQKAAQACLGMAGIQPRHVPLFGA